MIPTPEKQRQSLIATFLTRAVNARPHEVKALFYSCLYFFSLMCSYNILRPIREEMGIISGLENLQWLFLIAFFAMLAMTPFFGWITSKSPRSRFLPISYLFFISNLLIFYLLWKNGFDQKIVAQIFYVWISVFNLFVISVFWSFMTDIFNDEQAQRLFAFIASGGTIGALLGPLFTALLAGCVEMHDLLLVSIVFLFLSIFSIRRLSDWEKKAQEKDTQSPTPTEGKNNLKGGVLGGIRLVAGSRYLQGICILITLYGMLATFLYFQQLEIVNSHYTHSTDRMAAFAWIDFAVNALTLIFQLVLTGRIVKWIGIPMTLAIVPILLVLGFISISLAPTLITVVSIQVLRKAGNYAVMKPSREMLYVVLSKEEKYKAKNFIDTSVYRGADALSAWLYGGLGALGLGISQIAVIAAPLAALWAWVAFRLGKKHDQIKQQGSPPIPTIEKTRTTTPPPFNKQNLNRI